VYVGWHEATGSLIGNHFYWMDGINLDGNRSLFNRSLLDGWWSHDESDAVLMDAVRVEEEELNQML